MITTEKVKKGSTKKLVSVQEGVVEYSKLRSLFAVEIAKQTLSNPDKQIIKSIELASLLLDIGKSCEFKEKKVKFLHNEIGWAFLSKYLSGYEFVLDCVFWNNGITKKMGSYNNNNVLDTLNETDKLEMKKFLKNALSETSVEITSNEVKLDAPTYHSKDIIGNAKKTFIRSCVISADRLIASLKPVKLQEVLQTKNINSISHLISNLTQRNFNNSTNLNNEKQISFDNYDPNRMEIQKNIVESCDRTTVVNAPSGFGKCIVGLLWNILKSDKKMIWVCPRNSIAQAIYINILNELNSLGIINELSVELYLTGERKKTNVNYFIEEFNSDIIITNIDNFLNPSINMNNAERLFFINNCDVVFDEYHELVKKEAALYSCFINIMNVRNRFTNSRTILLSATPLKINNLWDNGINLKTKILPNENTHYPAIHKKKYDLYTYELNSIETFKTKQKASSVVVFNSISNSQVIHNQVNSGKLIHSDFSSKDKDKIFDFMYDEFGKDTSRFMSKENITGTHVIQAALDISFQNLYESVLSPLSTLQRIGRCDRWGDYERDSKISIYKIDNNGENKMKQILYTTSLSDKWFDFISKYNGKRINLDKFYEIYNEFHKINSVEINRYIENCHDKSLLNFVNIFPKHFPPRPKENKTFRAGSNKLRSTTDEIFFICKINNSEKYSDIISEHFKDFNEDEKTFGRIIKAMKSIRNMKDERFDYTRLIKEWDLNVIREASKFSDTPYIRFDVVYHPEHGVIKKSVLNKINKNK